MEKIKIPTPFNIDLDFELANMVQRFFAWFIDLLIQIAYAFIAYRIAFYFFDGSLKSSVNTASVYNEYAVLMLLSLPVLLYHLASEVTMNGQSIGKKLIGIKIISENGNRPSFYQFLLRWLLRPFETIFFFIPVFFCMLITKKNQRFGDLAAGTLVIVSRVKTNINNTVFLELDESYQPRYQNVLQLSDRDMNIIKTILDTSIKQKNYEFAERTSAKIRMALRITEYQHPVEFLETILKDYNYLSNKN